jgi:hypothetical protein
MVTRPRLMASWIAGDDALFFVPSCTRPPESTETTPPHMTAQWVLPRRPIKSAEPTTARFTSWLLGTLP